MPTFSPEATFHPARAPFEITSEVAGQRLIKLISKALHRPKWMLPMEVKLDPMHNVHGPNTTWCVEITPLNGFYWQTKWLEDPAQWAVARRAIAHVFKVCKDHGLVPSLVKRRGATESHYPGGGCHIHLGMGHLFTSTQLSRWYPKMEAFHTNLLMDYTNRPYVRWLFSHWFADAGTAVLVGMDDLHALKGPYDPMERARLCTSTIEPRFMRSNKGEYLSFEFRMFSMVESPEELRLIARFAAAWMAYVKKRTVGDNEYDTSPLQSIPLDLTADRLKGMRDPSLARYYCADFIKELGLQWKDYVPFFRRNYLRRIKWGAFV